ncbi:MAG: hypothetical protein AAF570_03775 [Bacteroidota bacterium]
MKKFCILLGFLLLTAFMVQAQDQRAGYHDNGKKKWQGNVIDGQKVGEWKYWHDNGQVQREGIYKEGKVYGVWKEYWRNGQVKSEGKYIVHNGESVKHGEWVYYHKNGAESAKGIFKGGKRSGIWFEYNTLGIQTKKKQY